MHVVLKIVAAGVVLVGIWIGLRPSKAQIESAKLMFFFGKTYNDHSIYDLKHAKDMLKHPSFRQCKPTVFYFHGFVEKVYDESVNVVVDAYLKRDDHNLIVVDWSELADGNYIFDAVPNHKRLGEAMSDMLLELFTEGLDVNKFHLVGHSLGAQLSGYIGRTVLARTKGGVKIKRITALDPAFPGFYPGILGTHLSQSDADLVDVIHTDAWLYGAPATTGSVDFWPNSGHTLQPGAPKRNYIPLSDNDLTSHRRSWWFWSESVARKDEKSFHSVKCKSWKDFKAGRCDTKAPIAYMGIDCKLGVTGDYYLQTNGASPYSRDLEGTKFHEEK